MGVAIKPVISVAGRSASSQKPIRFMAFCEETFEDQWISHYLGDTSTLGDLTGNRQLCEALASEALSGKGPIPTTVSSEHRVNSSRDLYQLFYQSGETIRYPDPTLKDAGKSEQALMSFVGDDNNMASGVEQADLLFLSSHGFPGKVALWNKGYFARGDRMRLGDGTRPLSIMALWACHSLALNGDIPDDNPLQRHVDYTESNMWALWGNTFKGGLKALLGAASGLGAEAYDTRHIKRFVKALQQGATVSEAWLTHIIPASFPEGRPRVLFSGKDKGDCFDRLNHLSLKNLRQYPPLRDDDIGVLCWRTGQGEERVDAMAKKPTPAPGSR